VAGRFLRITAETPYGECSERLTAFGGLLALGKFLDVIGFEQAFAAHYVRPKREPKLGGYRMVLGILPLLFIEFQRLGHFAYVQYDAMVCGVLRATALPAVSTSWRYLRSLSIVQSAALLRRGETLANREVARQIRQFRKLLPAHVQDVRVHGDAECISWDSVQACRDEGFQFTFGNKRCAPPFLEAGWYRYGDHEYNECRYQPGGWDEPCRSVAMRIRKDQVGDRQWKLLTIENYVYRVFVTNEPGRPHQVIDE
jgi:hypothetical protein